MDSQDSPLFSWRVHPILRRWKAGLLAAAVIGCAAGLVAKIMDHPAWGVFAALILGLGTNRFFFPTTYKLTAEGITARFPLRTVRYQWSDLRRFVYDQTGGFLSPRAKRSFLDEYRGISVLFSEDSQNIIQEIRSRLPQEAIVREVVQPTGGGGAPKEASETPSAHQGRPLRGAPPPPDDVLHHEERASCGG